MGEAQRVEPFVDALPIGSYPDERAARAALLASGVARHPRPGTDPAEAVALDRLVLADHLRPQQPPAPYSVEHHDIARTIAQHLKET